MAKLDLSDPIGRIHLPDENDQRYQIPRRAPATTEEQEILNRGFRYWWQDGWWGDQWFTPQCVTYAWTHLIEDGPITHAPRSPNRVSVQGQGEALINPQEAYDWCQLNDSIAGTNYDGTTVRAGAKYLQRLGLISGYGWAWDIDTAIRAVLLDGPVLVGTNWYPSMMETDEDGRLYVDTTGTPVYGHAYVINGISLTRQLFRIKNSWGRPTWGDSGNAYISIGAMEELINKRGEVCMPIELETE